MRGHLSRHVRQTLIEDNNLPQADLTAHLSTPSQVGEIERVYFSNAHI